MSIDKFDQWLATHGDKPDKYKMSLAVVYERAKAMGHSVGYVKGKIVELQRWLITHDGEGKTRKLNWGKFILKNLSRGEYQSARIKPSAFNGPSKVVDLRKVR